MEKRKIRRIVGKLQNGKGFIAVEYASGKVEIKHLDNKKALPPKTDKAETSGKTQT